MCAPRQGRPGGQSMSPVITFLKMLRFQNFSKITIYASTASEIAPFCLPKLLANQSSQRNIEPCHQKKLLFMQRPCLGSASKHHIWKHFQCESAQLFVLNSILVTTDRLLNHKHADTDEFDTFLHKFSSSTSAYPSGNPLVDEDEECFAPLLNLQKIEIRDGVNIRQDVSPRQGRPGEQSMSPVITF